MSIHLTELTVKQALTLLDNKQISSQDLTQAYLNRIAKLDPQVKAFLTQTPDLAMEQAKKADAERDLGNPQQKPLLGLPIAVKDVLALKDVRCTCGSRILEDFIPPYTATSVQRLLDAGVVILGKTNTDEFAMGSSTENSAYHTTHNPWNLEHVPGGSSGGSAAAVAARLAPAALGTDTGGSVRQPAALCGISGLKTTYGRISRYGLVAYGSSLDSVGVMAQSAEDISYLFNRLAGADERDASSAQVDYEAFQPTNKTDLTGKRIGLPEEYFIKGIQPEVETQVRTAIMHLQSLGAEIVPVSLPHTEYALPVYYLIAPAEASANLARYDGIRFGHTAEAKNLLENYKQTRGAAFGPEVKRRIMLGTYALSAGYYDAYYGQAQKVRTLIKRDFEAVFKTVDAVATPVAPNTAFKIGQLANDPLAMYLEDVFTLPTNLAGIPGLSIPVGFDQSGLPVGMQLLGPHFQENLLLEIAHAYQQTTDWHNKVPNGI